MENFEERYNELQHLSKVNYLKAEEEIQKYLRNELTQIQKLKLEIELANCFWLNSKLDEAEKLFLKFLKLVKI